MDHDPHPDRTQRLTLRDHAERSQQRLAMPLWLPAAVYRLIGDPDTTPVDQGHLTVVFDDQPEWLVDDIVEALIDYGVVRRVGDGLEAGLEVVSYNEDDAEDRRGT